MKLYSGPLSMFGMKAAIACYEKGLDFELEMVPFNADDRYLPKHPEVLRINPKAQVPVLIDGDLELFDSTQIFEYLEDRHPAPALWPSDHRLRAQARKLELLADEVYFPNVVRLMIVFGDWDCEEAIEARGECRAFYRQMENVLSGKDYLCGDYSFADIGLFMTSLFGERMTATLTDETPELLEWRARMMERDAVRTGVEPLRQHLLANNRPVPKFMN